MESEDDSFQSVADREKTVLAFWNKNNIFKKSEQGLAPRGWWEKLKVALFGKKEFVFYDGPPFATGLPHYGHILASAVKDAIPRYRTMRGYAVRRKWGWDCHGLPLEVEIEKEIGAKTKKDIEAFGIKEFNAKAREAIFRYAEEWKKIIPRMGRWVDMENDYRTVNTAYTESVWNVFHRLHTKGFVQEGYKSLHLCPRCSTTLSSNEVTEGYRDTKDIAVYALFPLKDDPKTCLVAWTTTPWTLLGNTALAVHKDLSYAVIEKDGKRYIAHANAMHLFEGGVVVEEKKGADLVGLEYEPIFPALYRDEPKEMMQRVWHIYHADYIDTAVGTGIVHLAPAYGAEDMELAEKHGIPIRHHVNKDGEFIEKLGEPFAGLRPKEKGNPKEVDALILNAMRERGKLLMKETIEHSYPFCWRCETPLLNYATDSWFIDVEKYREEMCAANKKIKWIPSHLRDGRFGNWLAQSRAWAVSRSRFWGAPLPIWRTKETGKITVVSSIPDMLQRMRPRNEYMLIRHAQAQRNLDQAISCRPNEKDTLTSTGEAQGEELAKRIVATPPTIIFTSPLKRTRQTAEYVAKATGAKVITDDRLLELQIPSREGDPWADVLPPFRLDANIQPSDTIKTEGESYFELYERILSFLGDVDENYANEKIAIVSHRAVLCAFRSIAPTLRESILSYRKAMRGPCLGNAETEPFSYLHLRRDENLDIDLHRPYIDDIVLCDDDDNEAHHIREVFDCWFESGAMPYASHHYPFANTDVFDPKRKKGFPADFICEGLDQTRGWFYSLIAIGVGAFNQAPYKQVITTGLIRAADGKKMSKSLKNYTSPTDIIDQYGADALRHYLLGSPVTQGQDLDFQDEGVNEIYKKVYGRLHNCLVFYKTYASLPHQQGGTSALDTYIRHRFAQTLKEMTDGFESYQLTKAVQPIGSFVEDLSVWYLRRSRDVLRQDTVEGAQARETLRSVLMELAKCIAPIAPFYAEFLYQQLHSSGGADVPESVHLCRWSDAHPVDHKVLAQMDLVRNIVSVAHEQRSETQIKVRQPLQRLTVNVELHEELRHIIAEEVNVKEVVSVPEQETLAVLDTTITEDLREEGFVRDFVRVVQNERKRAQFALRDIAQEVLITAPEKQKMVLQKFETHLQQEVQTQSIRFVDDAPADASAHEIGGVQLHIALRK